MYFSPPICHPPHLQRTKLSIVWECSFWVLRHLQLFLVQHQSERSNRGARPSAQTEACQILIFKRSQICKFSCKISWVFITGNQFSSHSWVLLWRVSNFSPHRLKCDWDQRTWEFGSHCGISVWIPLHFFSLQSWAPLTTTICSWLLPARDKGDDLPSNCHLMVHVLKYSELQFCATQTLCSA